MLMQAQLVALALGIVALLASSTAVGCAFLVHMPPSTRTRGSYGVVVIREERGGKHHHHLDSLPAHVVPCRYT